MHTPTRSHGFITYDELEGPDLDATRWGPARLPLPTGELHVPLDPNAELVVGSGEVRVTIPRFSLSHDRFQAVDSPKYLPSRRTVRAAAGSARDVRRRPRGREHRRGPGDYRRGMAAFHVFDLASSNACSPSAAPPPACSRCTSSWAWAVAEQASPSTTWSSRPTRTSTTTSPGFAQCEITLDRSRSTAAWRVDGHTVYEAHGTLIPERAHIGFGIWTMLPIRDGRSRSLDGQGMNARWRRFRVRGVEEEIA